MDLEDWVIKGYKRKIKKLCLDGIAKCYGDAIFHNFIYYCPMTFDTSVYACVYV